MTRVILFLALALVIPSCSMSIDELDDDLASNEMVKEEIGNDFIPENEYKSLPKKGELIVDVDLEGTWSSPGGFDYTTITFEKMSSEKYSAKFDSGGCLMEWTLDREATYKNGIITFNKAVEEYSSPPYSMMYTIRFKECIYLIASERIKDFEEDTDPNIF